ncbi:arabinosyltransferase C-terminal domain-containing protein, partial [Nocardia wallacei]|uniref:arabinosyltransferase C-terminal domain-containing protein n=1 Tax=Nocardia wallacei TaxID=480035 RepID=UPI003CC7DD80
MCDAGPGPRECRPGGTAGAPPPRRPPPTSPPSGPSPPPLAHRPAAHDTNLGETHDGGGPLGWSQQLLRTETLATYLRDDWSQD